MPAGPAVAGDPLAHAVEHIRSRSRKEGALYERGARELLAFLATRGKPLSAVRAVDVTAFKDLVRAREGEEKAGRERAKAKIAGACAYLRFESCRGAIEEDEALFFALNERIGSGVIASAFGEGVRARVLREAAGFRQTLTSSGKSEKRGSKELRAVARLLFFLERQGKTVEEIEPGDYLCFEEETKRGCAASSVLAGARAYLRSKGIAEKLGQAREGWLRPREIESLARLPAAWRDELLAFRKRLPEKLSASKRHAYVFGARELLLFALARGSAIESLRLADWQAFEAEIRARVERRESGPSWMSHALSGARRFLRERARSSGRIDEELLPEVTPADLAARAAIEVAGDRSRAALLEEVKAFAEERVRRGYSDYLGTRQGALALLRFLARQGRGVSEITAADWQAFLGEATRGTRYSGKAPLVAGAAAYLQLKVEQGVLARSPVPPPLVHRRSAPVLSEELANGLAALEEGLAAQDLALHTRRSYRSAVWTFLLWASEEHGVLRIGEITREMTTAYRLRLQSEPSSKGTPYAVMTQVGCLAALRFFFGWLVKTGRLLVDPTRHLCYPRLPRQLPRSLKVSEITRLIRSLPEDTFGLRDRAIVELLYGTGMRRAELAQLDLGDVDFEERQILIRQGKGGKDRVVPLGRKAKEALSRYLERARVRLVHGRDPGAVFLGRDGRRLGKGQVGERMRSRGLSVRLKLSPHLLRHSCATHLLRGRADIRHIQRLLGHESLQTTERYTKVELADLRGVIDRCHPREKGSKS